MGDNLLDDLDGLFATKSTGDETFRNELSYYSSLPGVKVDGQIASIYDRKVSVASNAKIVIKNDKKTIKMTSERIQDDTVHSNQREVDFQNSESNYHREQAKFLRQSREYRKKVAEARKKYRGTAILSEESKQAREAYKSIVVQQSELREQRKQSRIKHEQDIARHNMEKELTARRMKENREKIAEKEAEIKEQTAKMEEAQNYATRLVEGIRKQFKTVDRMLAIRDSIKCGDIDLNAPQNKELAGYLSTFTTLINQNPLKISITDPITDKDSQLTACYTKIQELMERKGKEDYKKSIESREQARIAGRETYVKRLQEDPSLDQLDDSKNNSSHSDHNDNDGR